MEPSGRNRWQSVANGTPAKAAQKGKTRCRGYGKEGVDGSSPSEGSAKSPQNGPSLYVFSRSEGA
jgi:hypothetical protein